MTRRFLCTIKITVISLIGIILLSCTDSHNHELTAGMIKDGVYRNKYLGIRIVRPISWHSRMTRNNKSGHDGHLTKVNLFAWFERRVDSKLNTGFNSNILGMAERVVMSSGVITGKQYLESIIILMKKSAVNYRVSPVIKSIKLGERDFNVLEVEALIAGQTIKVRYYTNIYKGFAFSVITSWQTNEQFQLIKSTLSSLKFNR